MQKHRSRTVSTLASAALLLLLHGAASAEDLDKATRDTFKSIITQQIEAFGAEDSDKAESFASPGIKAKFPDPKEFLAMVQRSYPPLIHPRSTRFDDGAQSSLGPLQKVTIVDKDGVAWTAAYTFEQVDGQWRITGCALVKEQSTNV